MKWIFLSAYMGIILHSTTYAFIVTHEQQRHPLHHYNYHQRKLASTSSTSKLLHSLTDSSKKTLSPSNIALKSTHSSIHLISLPPLYDDKSPKIIKDIWKWKDVVLGDGRDYFIPRPRALKSLSDVIVGSALVSLDEYEYEDGDISDNERHYRRVQHIINECAILSNCARLDILLSIETIVNMDSNYDVKQEKKDSINFSKEELQSLAQKASTLLIANCLHHQLTSYQNIRHDKGSSAIVWEGISSFLDLPGMVVTKNDNKNDSSNNENIKVVMHIDEINEPSKMLANLLHSNSEIHDIINHFCLVAAGLAPRESRPQRAVHFRPFSSRDAHIMLQLKRTVEVAIGSKMNIILSSALNAGKAARDVNKVPILKQMKNYDCEGKYSTAAPPQLAAEAVEEVKVLAIQPAIDMCLDKLMSQHNKEKIVLFKREVDLMMKMKEGNNIDGIKKLVHNMTMELRNGTMELDDAISLFESKLMCEAIDC